MKKLLLLLLCVPLIGLGQEIYKDTIPPNTNYKTKLKTNEQYISILYDNLFQEAISDEELVEIIHFIEDIGDKQVAYKIVLSNFMNKKGVIIPSDSIMRIDIESFLTESYTRFYARNITEAEKEFFTSFIENNLNVTVKMIYTEFALASEYQYY